MFSLCNLIFVFNKTTISIIRRDYFRELPFASDGKRYYVNPMKVAWHLVWER